MHNTCTHTSRFFLLPALLGDLTLQLSEGDRLGIVSKARVYCVDYLQRCKSYAITKEVQWYAVHLCSMSGFHTALFVGGVGWICCLLSQCAPFPPYSQSYSFKHTNTQEPPSSPASSAEATPTAGAVSSSARKSYDQMAAERSAKIARLKAQKEIEKKVEVILSLSFSFPVASSSTHTGVIWEVKVPLSRPAWRWTNSRAPAVPTESLGVSLFRSCEVHRPGDWDTGNHGTNEEGWHC